MMRIPRITKLLALLLALALVAAACGDDDDDTAASDDDGATSEPTEEPTEAPAGDDGDEPADDGDTEPTEEPTDEPTDDGGEEPMATGVLEFVPLDVGGPITKQALADGDIDVALLFTSDADIAANGWVLLDDDLGLQQIENLIPAIRTDAASPEVEAVLNAVSAPLTTPELTELNRQVTQDLIEPAEAAEAWLTDQGLIPWAGDPVDASLNVGSTNFFEQEIVAELYSIALESAGADISRTFQMGAREVVAPALSSGEIDLYPEYIGTYTKFYDSEAAVPADAEEAAAQLRELIAGDGLTVLNPAPAEDRNGIVVTPETADTYGLSVTSDLASVEDVLVFGGPPECPERDFCLIGLTNVYGLTFN